jgi:hypothetical protein
MICACLITRLPTEMLSLRPTTLKPSRRVVTGLEELVMLPKGRPRIPGKLLGRWRFLWGNLSRVSGGEQMHAQREGA